jgi:nucleoid-associated protein YgaU
MPSPSLKSRYLNVALERDADGRQLFEIRRPLPRLLVTGTRTVTVQQGDTIFHMAFREYGDPLMYWAIADFNGIFDVTTEFVEGMEIEIPPSQFITEYLSPSSA